MMSSTNMRKSLEIEVDNEYMVFCSVCKKTCTATNLCPHYTTVAEQNEDEEKENIDNSQLEEGSFDELLIANVQARPQLWDSKLKLTDRSKTIKDKLWLEIFEFFGEQYPIETLQKKWKNLRDTYVKAKSEIEAYVPSGSATKRKKPWKYYELLSFLSDGLAARPTISNIECEKSTMELFQTPKCKKKNTQESSLDTNILVEAINKIPQPPLPPLMPKINPICMRISDLLETVSDPKKKCEIEIKLLQLAYEQIYNNV